MLNSQFFLRVNFLMALIAALGSLYLSEVVGFPPCTLCWYQRAFMYPLALVFGTALWTDDAKWPRYALPIALVGLVIAIYHNLIYYDFVSEGMVPCEKGLSCKTRQLELFGFITIPLMSLGGFLAISLFSFLGVRSEKQ